MSLATVSTGASGAALRKTDARAASSTASTDGGEMAGLSIGLASEPVEMERGLILAMVAASIVALGMQHLSPGVLEWVWWSVLRLCD